MLTQKIIELAQAATSTDINQNLQNTENQLQNINANLDLIKEEYNAVASQPANYSFFNLNNIYFWFVLAGLLLLAFGLLFLLAELQNKDKKKKFTAASVELDKEEVQGASKEEPEKDEEIAIEVKKPKAKENKSKKSEVKKELIPEPAKEQTPRPKKPTGPIKIKVEKLK